MADQNNFGKELWMDITDARWFANVNINQGMNRTIIQMKVSVPTLGQGYVGYSHSMRKHTTSLSKDLIWSLVI